MATFVIMWISISILIIIVILVIVYYWIYNQLVAARETVDEAMATIDVQLKKRFDLVPRLVEITKAYSSYESELLQRVTELRAIQKNDQEIIEKEDAGLSVISRSMRVKVEDYPDLKANEQFLKLMDQLTLVEEELAMARRYLNGTIRDFNTKVDMFPHVIISRHLGFEERRFYEIESLEKEPQKIFQ